MARARITYHYASGDMCDLEIVVNNSFPDAVDEARMQVQKLYDAIVREPAEAGDEQ